MWQESLQVSCTPIVYVRVFKSSEKNTPQYENKNIAEVGKYAIKDSKILTADETVYILYKVLGFRHLVSFGGLMKTEHKK